MCVCCREVWQRPLGEEEKGRRAEERGSFEKQQAGEMTLECRQIDSYHLSCMAGST